MLFPKLITRNKVDFNFLNKISIISFTFIKVLKCKTQKLIHFLLTCILCLAFGSNGAFAADGDITGNGNVTNGGGSTTTTNGVGDFPWWPIGNETGGGITLNYTCPLIDQDGTGDLMSSLDILEKAIPTSSACKNETNYEELSKKQLEMRSAVVEIKKMWRDPDEMWSKGKTDDQYLEQINGFSTHVATLMNNINYVSESLGKNELINSNCGRQMITKGRALYALSDLVSQLSPYAVFAASATSAMQFVDPIIMGFAGIASIIKTVSQLNKSNLLDMNLYENRQTLLKATCEYMRIENRIRDIHKMQIGFKTPEAKSKKLNEIYNSLQKQIQNGENEFKQKIALTGMEDSQDFLTKRKEFYSETAKFRKQLVEDWNSYLKIEKTMNKNTEESALCALGQVILARKGSAASIIDIPSTTETTPVVAPSTPFVAAKFPFNLEDKLKELNAFYPMEEDEDFEVVHRIFIKGITDFETNVNAAATSTGVSTEGFPFYNNGPTCGSATKDFVKNILIKYLDAYEQRIIAVENDFEKKLKKDPIYMEWYVKNSKLVKERDTLQRVVNVISRSSQAMSEMGQSELNQRLENLRNTLFGTKSYLPLNSFVYKIPFIGSEFNLKNQSPIGDWLAHTAQLQAEKISHFDNAYNNLIDQIKKNYDRDIAYDKEIRKRLPREGFSIAPRWKSSNYKVENYFRYLSQEQYPLNSKQHEYICKILEEISLDWEKSMSHLGAMKNLCSTLLPFIDTKTGEGVVKYCGITKLNPNEYQNTEIDRIDSKLIRKGFRNAYNEVTDKIVELKCSEK